MKGKGKLKVILMNRKSKRNGEGKGTIEGKGIVKGKGNSKNSSIETGTLGGRNLHYCHPLFTIVTLFGRIQKQYWRGPVNLPIVTPFINARLALPLLTCLANRS